MSEKKKQRSFLVNDRECFALSHFTCTVCFPNNHSVLYDPHALQRFGIWGVFQLFSIDITLSEHFPHGLAE